VEFIFNSTLVCSNTVFFKHSNMNVRYQVRMHSVAMLASLRLSPAVLNLLVALYLRFKGLSSEEMTGSE